MELIHFIKDYWNVIMFLGIIIGGWARLELIVRSHGTILKHQDGQIEDIKAGSTSTVRALAEFGEKIEGLRRDIERLLNK